MALPIRPLVRAYFSRVKRRTTLTPEMSDEPHNCGLCATHPSGRVEKPLTSQVSAVFLHGISPQPYASAASVGARCVEDPENRGRAPTR